MTAFTQCVCGKRSFWTRRDARHVANAMRGLGEHVRPYPCPHPNGHGWHVGHLPRAVRNGRTTASDYYGREAS